MFDRVVTYVHHAPGDHVCPFCLLVAGIEDARVLSVQNDIVFKNEFVTAFIAARQWPNNKGHVLVIPNAHFENLYDLPNVLGAEIHKAARSVALAMKFAYQCEGISTRQHNEPAGNQEVWHYHLHVSPRFGYDDLYQTEGQLMAAEERAGYVEALRAYLK